MTPTNYLAGQVRDELAKHLRTLADALLDATSDQRPALTAAISSLENARAQLAEVIREGQ